MTTSLHLPWPPSVNRYWRHPSKGKLAGRHLISADGRAYREQVRAEVLASRMPSHGAGYVAITIDCYPPDKRRRDLDNILKALLDALCYAGLYDDDSQIKRLHLEMWPAPCPNPGVRVEIAKFLYTIEAAK